MVAEGNEPHMKLWAHEERHGGRWREGEATKDEDGDTSRMSKRGSMQ
jgi:hypothetical protein